MAEAETQVSMQRNRCRLDLYIAGSTSRSQRAVKNIRKICEETIPGQFDLRVIDVLQHPLLAKADQVIAVPALIKKSPSPRQLFIGDMSDTAAILDALACV